MTILDDDDLNDSLRPMTHTPGPWKTYQSVSGIHDTPTENWGVAEENPKYATQPHGICDGIVHGEADARLIAAAPELLAALKRISNIKNHAVHNLLDAKQRITELERIARAAIAKALEG